jgi:hypothetical protein
MKKLITLTFLLIALPAFSQPLNEIYGTKPRVGQGACSAKSVQEMDGVLMTVKMKKNYDWIIDNCKNYKAIVENKFPDRLQKETKLDLTIYSYLKDCYSEKDIDKIMAKSKPQANVKSCSFSSNDAAVGGVMNLLGNY